MSKSQKLNPGTGQLRWVILLLAAAVILPTVCLLWFMVQAVKNVELAARQERINFYQEQLKKASQQTSESWIQQLKQIDELVSDKEPYEMFDELIALGYDGVVIYSEAGERVYPVLSGDVEKPPV
ncbi:MAG: hypothetical protein ACYTE8_08435, partial [Planctomycetota bacterium]